MPLPDYKAFIKHLNSIIHMYEDAVLMNDNLNQATALGILARAESAVQKICGEKSTYVRAMRDVLSGHAAHSYQAELIIGIINALKSELEDGYLGSMSELVRGELFEDFTEMADHLLQEGYKDAAAVIAGSTLEAHIRRLCDKNNIPTNHSGTGKDIKAEQLNQDLGKGVYSLYDQKRVTSWLDIRNNAAHGAYSKYTSDQVFQLIESVRDFIAKNPA